MHSVVLWCCHSPLWIDLFLVKAVLMYRDARPQGVSDDLLKYAVNLSKARLIVSSGTQ